MNWQPIETHPIPEDEYSDSPPPVLVDNGERVGEARLTTSYSDWDGDSDTIPWRWGWTHHSTCSCCFTHMSKQPLFWQPLPEGHPDARSENPSSPDQSGQA